MNRPLSILLPGLDGTAELFESFVTAAPSGFPVRPLPLPTEGPQSYSVLAAWLSRQLPRDPVVLVAESFSGPLAVLAARECRNVVALVLCASFVESPLPRALAYFPRLLGDRPPPAALLRLFLTGGDHDLAQAVQRAVSRVPARIVAERISAALRVDVGSELQSLTQPVLYVRATQDRLVGRRSAARIQALRPSTRVAEISAPHMVLQTRPAEAWRQIQAFLQEASDSLDLEHASHGSRAKQ